ncbi:EAL domain-containing protein [Bordetella sp. FB-8]|uniref:EAL domain-containing protein n=1 Tax=Bordetella sp. FB-8 TaxID=1159870 RepID=UPI00037379F5|nr:EAL domain-containing protein [Bordetella sp. FB-8]
MPLRTALPETPATRDNPAETAIVIAQDEAQLYGPACEPGLSSLLLDIAPLAARIIDAYNLRLEGMPRSRHLLKALSDEERVEIKRWQVANLLGLLEPGLTAQTHEAMARAVGRRLALSCVGKEELAFTKDLLYALIIEHVGRNKHDRTLPVLSARMMRDLAWHLTVYQEIHAQRTRLLLSITRLAWEAGSYVDLIAKTAELLAGHPGICACLIGRPGNMKTLCFEALEGIGLETYLARAQAIRSSRIDAGEPWLERSPAEKAWRSNRIEHCINVATDADMPIWRGLALEYGFHSIVAVPLASQSGIGPTAMLGLYSNYPGGFSSDDQIAFLKQLQSLLTYAILRLDAQENVVHPVPYQQRRRWADLLKTEALCMHYQPLLDLKTRRIVKVEALARLRDGDRLLSPGEFFAALTSEDFLVLYARGLDQTLRQWGLWQRSGLNPDLAVSINMPADALGDIRYYDATVQALTRNGCPPSMLTLEILETDDMSVGIDVVTALDRYRELGVSLAEDDLGSGHSSLKRMRELPFDAVKIDRSLVVIGSENSADVLHFIFQLTRLGHSLGKNVIVEGVEDEGLLEAVTILGADAIQGYVLTPPLPADEITAWLAAHPTYPEPVRKHSVLGQMARLLIWEECLYLLRDEASVMGLASDVTPPALPLDIIDPGLSRVFMLAAINQGPSSPEYRRIREKLMQALSDRTI